MSGVARGRGARRGSGTLFVVATPIGNLGDLSVRAAGVLRTVAAVAAEDTRRTRRLYSHLGARPPPLCSLPGFEERRRLAPILRRLAAGEDVALLSDAGTPSVSDPGRALVAAAWEAGARVVPLPGPCAAVAALSASGLPADRFLVAGFLPRRGAARSEALEWLAGIPATLVIYEAGNRVAATLRHLAAALGDRPAALGREITKLHEEIARGRLSELAERFQGRVRGEVTLVVAGAETAPRGTGAEPLDAELRRRLAAGEAPAAAARAVGRARGLPRREVYARLLALSGARRA